MRNAISKLNCALLIASVICFGEILRARAETEGGIKLNQAGSTFATELIEQGHVVADGKGSWSEHHPSVVEENEFLRVHGFSEYAKWHLGIDPRFSENSKRRYKFPYGDFKNVHRCGLLAAKARARQYGYSDIKDVAAELVRTVKTKSKD